jgi:outer membrane protein OmpA-like peptidoglycan-associated protein
MLIRLFCIGVIFHFFCLCGFAQQDRYNWRVGIYGGDMIYYGELNKQFSPPNPLWTRGDWDYFSYGVSLETFLSNAWSVKGQYTTGRFTANDIKYDWKDNIRLAKSDFTRSLNVMTEINDWGLLFTYYFDNNRLWSKRAFFAPYLSLGVSYTQFKTYADLFGAGGARYYYWASDRTIRNLPDGDMSGVVVKQDGIFETELTKLQTEGKQYAAAVLSLPLAIGFKFRLSNRLNFNIETVMRYVMTDYLDDVSGNYLSVYDSELQAHAGNPSNNPAIKRGKSGENDWYVFNSISLHYSFGKRTQSTFTAPKIYSGQEEAPLLIPDTTSLYVPKADSTQALPKETQITTAKQLIQPTNWYGISLRPTQPENTVKYVSTGALENYSPAYMPTQSNVSNNLANKSQNPPSGLRGRSEAEITQMEREVRYLEALVKKQKLEKELLTINQPNQTDPNQTNQTDPSNIQPETRNPATIPTTSNSSPVVTEPTPYQQAQWVELQKKIEILQLQNELNIRESTKPIGNSLVFRQIDSLQKTRSSLDSLQRKSTDHQINALKQKAKQDSIQAYRNTQTQLDMVEMNRQILALTQAMVNPPRTQPNQANPNEAILAEITSLQRQVADLQKQVANLKPTQMVVTPKTTTQNIAYTRELGKFETFFETSIYVLSANEQMRLQNFAKLYERQPNRFVIQGFADLQGNPQQNILLSQKRAENVRNTLLNVGVLSENIQVEPYGSHPTFGRRVVVVVMGN